MSLGVAKTVAAAAFLVSTALAPLAQAQLQLPLRKFEIHKITCGEASAVAHPEARERLLVYMNGYLDGTVKATTWDAELVGKRIDEVLRACSANPKVSLLEAFKRAWAR